MKKLAFVFVCIALGVLCFRSFAGAEDVSAAARKAARIALAAAMKLKDKKAVGILKGAVQNLKKLCVEKPLEAVKGGIGIVAGIFTVGTAWNSYSNGNEEGKQKRELSAARQSVSNLMCQNADGEIGAYGLPKACDAAAQALVTLPGGEEELQKLIVIFQKYFVSHKKPSMASRILFWKKTASEGVSK